MNPFVSVLIPAFNARGTIERALRSVLIQGYGPLEIIVVNDASTDDTAAVAEGLNIPELRLINLEKNQGECGAMNAGLKIAQGKYIAFLDADDEWRPGKLGKQIPLLERDPEMIFATCGCLFVDPAGNPFREFGVHPPTPPTEIWRALLSASCVAKPCVVARRSALESIGGFNVGLRVSGDQDMWIKLAARGKVGFVEELLVWAHDTPGSLTKVHAQRTADYLMPMIERNIADLRDRLTPSEIRHILGERYTFIGRNLYSLGSVGAGLKFLMKGITKGNRVAENLWYAITASPPSKFVKARLLRSALGFPGAPLSASKNAASSPLLAPEPIQLAVLPSGPPILSVVIDTEAEFDWSRPFRRDMTDVANVKQQERAQQIFNRYSVKPTYVVAYAVAAQESGFKPLLEFLQSKQCSIGAHLQPWENPPFEEGLGQRNSFVGNLPLALQQSKLNCLTDVITKNLKIRPVVYKAGRYGVNDDAAALLEACGYEIDVSVLPVRDLSAGEGPDFSRVFNKPYWFGQDRKLFEIPMTVGLVGALANIGGPLYRRIANTPLETIHVPGIFARLGLLERITLTPEGVSLEEMVRLTRSMLAQGHRVFTLTYHSSSLLVGGSPYVKTSAELDRFTKRLEGYLEFFFRELGGVAMDVAQVRDLARQSRVLRAA